MEHPTETPTVPSRVWSPRETLSHLVPLLQHCQTLLTPRDTSLPAEMDQQRALQPLFNQIEAFLFYQRALAQLSEEARRTLLPLDKEGILQLTAEHFLRKRTVILGQSGAGKSNALITLLEGLLDLHIPATVIDPEGEAWSLRELHPEILVIGRSEHADREYGVEQMAALAEIAVRDGRTVVLDLDGYLDKEMYALVAAYLQGLWQAVSKSKGRRPYLLAVDEVQEFVPQQGNPPTKELLIRFAKRGRKRGVGMIFASQQTTSVDNQILTQTDNRFLFGVSYPSDLARYKTLMPRIAEKTSEEVEEAILSLTPGQGYVIVNHRPHLVTMLRRRSFDPGDVANAMHALSEPIIAPLERATLETLDQELATTAQDTLEFLDRPTLLARLRTALHTAPNAEPAARPSSAAAKAKIQSLQQRIVELETRVRDAHDQLAAKERELAQVRLSTAQETTPDTASGQMHHWDIAQATIHSLVVAGALPPEAEQRDAQAQLMAVVSELEAAQQRLSTQTEEISRLRQTRESAPDQPEDNAPYPTLPLTPIDEFLWESVRQAVLSLRRDPLAQAVARLLFAYEQKHLSQALTLKELAARLQCKAEQLRPHLPTQLVDFGLIAAIPQGSAHTLHYRSQVRVYLRKEFQEQQIEPLLQELVRLLAQPAAHR